jgi:hypothetical protein
LERILKDGKKKEQTSFISTATCRQSKHKDTLSNFASSVELVAQTLSELWKAIAPNERTYILRVGQLAARSAGPIQVGLVSSQRLPRHCQPIHRIANTGRSTAGASASLRNPFPQRLVSCLNTLGGPTSLFSDVQRNHLESTSPIRLAWRTGLAHMKNFL